MKFFVGVSDGYFSYFFCLCKFFLCYFFIIYVLSSLNDRRRSAAKAVIAIMMPPMIAKPYASGPRWLIRNSEKTSGYRLINVKDVISITRTQKKELEKGLSARL